MLRRVEGFRWCDGLEALGGDQVGVSAVAGPAMNCLAQGGRAGSGSVGGWRRKRSGRVYGGVGGLGGALADCEKVDLRGEVLEAVLMVICVERREIEGW